MEMEAEEERKRRSHLAKFVHDKAVLAANKKAEAEAEVEGHRTSHRGRRRRENHVSHYSRFYQSGRYEKTNTTVDKHTRNSTGDTKSTGLRHRKH